MPEPDTPLQETLTEFAISGFNASDAIGLTACGHTLGNVHHSGFPTVADASTVSDSNTGGAQPFDLTPTAFDVNVVHEYLNGTGKCGGTLVTSFNESSRSDLRLYESDGNATMKVLGQSSDYFIKSCTSLLTRMIDTVPSAVTLTDVIDRIPLKPVNTTFDISRSGNQIVSGVVRVRTSILFHNIADHP